MHIIIEVTIDTKYQVAIDKGSPTACCQISYTLPEIPFEITEITEIPKSEIKES